MMPVFEVNFRRNPFKVISPVVILQTVDVVNVCCTFWIVYPAGSNNAMHKSLPAKRKIPAIVLCGRVWLQLSKNFPAT